MTHSVKRTWHVGLTFLATAILLAACGSPATPSPNASPPPVETPAAAATSTPVPSAPPSPEYDAVLLELAEITAALRGLEPKGEVTQTLLSDEAMRQRMRERLEEDLDPDELEAEQRVLAMLDLVEPDLDLKGLLMELYSGQVTGYYDTREKELAVRQFGDDLGVLERVTFVHEFTHALQDQHFDLQGTMERIREQDDSDQRAGYRALVEGDAMLTEWHYILDHLTEDELFGFLFGVEAEPVPEETPDYILRRILFPYQEGFDFVSQLHRRGGWEEVNRAYADPPRSSTHILHLERYLEGEEPISVGLSDLGNTLGLGNGWRLRLTDVLGEFSLSLHLAVHLEEEQAKEAARGWHGDRYAYFEDDAGEGLLVMLTRWDGIADARFFFETYVELIEVKSAGGWRSFEDGPELRRWETGQGREFILQRDGDAVLLVWAPDGSVAAQILP